MHIIREQLDPSLFNYSPVVEQLEGIFFLVFLITNKMEINISIHTFKIYIYLFILCVVGTWHTYMHRSEDNVTEWILSPYNLSSRNQIQVLRFVGKDLHLQRHVSSPPIHVFF